MPILRRLSAQAAPALRLAAPLAAALALRLYLLNHLFQATGDTLVYGDLAKNLLLHGRYALTAPNGDIHSTLIRLPGYPLFLTACLQRLLPPPASGPPEWEVSLLGGVAMPAGIERLRRRRIAA